jgi:hypothetical protein
MGGFLHSSQDRLRSCQGCARVCVQQSVDCDAAEHAAEDPLWERFFNRVVLTAIEDESAMVRLWPDVAAHLQQLRPAQAGDDFPQCVLVRASARIARLRGRQGNWRYLGVEKFGGALLDLLLAGLRGADASSVLEAGRVFREAARQLFERHWEPYDGCERVCTHDRTCVYRGWMADVIASGSFTDVWYENRWEACHAAAYLVLDDRASAGAAVSERLRQASRRAGLCFGLQMLAQDPRFFPDRRRDSLEKLITISEEKLQ